MRKSSPGRTTAVRVMTFFALAALAIPASAQNRVRGSVYSSLYISETGGGTQLWDSYYGARFTAEPGAVDNLKIRGNFRLTRRGDPSEWSERLYNAYADWRSASRKVGVRVGRQFMYTGVINGSFDGALVSLSPTKDLKVRLLGGFSTPYDRSVDVQSWDDGGAVGAHASYRVAPEARVAASFIQQRRGGEVAWSQFGGSVTGVLGQRLYYTGRLDYNLEKSEYQAARARLTYNHDRWNAHAEFNSQKPRIYEDSYFNVFKLVAFNQIRGGAGYRFGQYETSLQLLHTIYDEDESTDEILAAVSGPWGTVGAVVQTGYGGENLGAFGEIRYDIVPELTVMVRSSHYTYERRSLIISEDATSFSGGLRYRPISPLVIQAEIQESLNTYFDNDLRALLRVQYGFDLRSGS